MFEHILHFFCTGTTTWKSPTAQTVFVLYAGIARRVSTTACRAARDARASSSELSKSSCIIRAWRTCHARLTRITGSGASFAGFRSACR